MNQEQSILRDSVKQKAVFAGLMGIITTGSVSFTVILINLGFTGTFWRIWLKSWLTAFLIAFPLILIVSPQIKRFVEFLFRESSARRRCEDRSQSENKDEPFEHD